MSDADRAVMLRAMKSYGGDFVQALAEAWSRADAKNAARLEDTFHDLVRVYGPGSRFFDELAGWKA